MKRGTVAVVVGLVVALLVAAASETLHADDDATLLKQAQTLFKPLPRTMGAPDLPTAPARVALGRMLFFDPRWTLEGNGSCATCHQPALYGTDALAKSIGVQHRTHPRNAPTARWPVCCQFPSYAANEDSPSPRGCPKGRAQ
jgi:cytochrome c peroxidase